MKVTVCIPCYNEEKSIANVLQGVKKHAGNKIHEILVVGALRCKDRTIEISKKHKARVIIDHGKGKGEAMRFALSQAKGDIVVFMDADESHEPKDILKLIKPIKDKKADIVVASRMLGGSDELHGTFNHFCRNIGTALIVLVINRRFKSKLTDVENGFRAVHRKKTLALNLNANDQDIEQEMVMKALKKGLRVCEVPSHEFERKYGESNIKLAKTGWKFVWRLIREL